MDSFSLYRQARVSPHSGDRLQLALGLQKSLHDLQIGKRLLGRLQRIWRLGLETLPKRSKLSHHTRIRTLIIPVTLRPSAHCYMSRIPSNYAVGGDDLDLRPELVLRPEGHHDGAGDAGLCRRDGVDGVDGAETLHQQAGEGRYLVDFLSCSVEQET